MAKFCSKCGKPLVEGIPCDCEKNKENNESELEKNSKVTEKMENEAEKAEEEEIESEFSKQIGSIINKYITIFKKILKKPMETIKEESINTNFIFGIISIIINAIIFGVLINGIIDNTLKKVGVSLNTIKSALGIVSKIIPIDFNTNFGLNVGIGMIIMSFIIPCVAFGIQEWLLHKKANIKQMIAMVGVCEVFLSIGCLVSLIISYISPLFATIVLTFFVIAFLVRIHQGLIEITKLNKNQLAYTVSFSILIPSVGATVVISLLSIMNFATIVISSAGSYLTSLY